MNDPCYYCKNKGVLGDEFTGGESYCTCYIGQAIMIMEKDRDNLESVHKEDL